MSIKDKIKVVLFIATMGAISFGSMYYGYKHPEIYLDMYMQTPVNHVGIERGDKINIRNYCPPDPHKFTVFSDEYWCIA